MQQVPIWDQSEQSMAEYVGYLDSVVFLGESSEALQKVTDGFCGVFGTEQTPQNPSVSHAHKE